MGLFRTTLGLIMPQSCRYGDALGPHFPTSHILARNSWYMIMWPRWDSVLPRETWKESNPHYFSYGWSINMLIQLETHETISYALMPSQPLGNTINVFLANQGANPLVIIMRALIFDFSHGGIFQAFQQTIFTIVLSFWPS